MTRLVCVALVVASSALALGSPQVRATGCDRACLEGLMGQYLTALAAHDPSHLPTTPKVKYTENSQVVPLGTGEWLVAGNPGTYRHTFCDPQSGEVASITTITENGTPTIYVVRLKVESDGKISEIDSQITRDAGGAALYENMTKPAAEWLETVPVADRVPRDTIISQANRYYSGMQRNDPKGDYSFFDDDCNRLEDAVQTTNVKTGATYGHSNDTVFASLTCAEQFSTGFLGFVTKIRDRRYVVDEERQAAIAFTIFDHNGTVRSLPDINGTSSPIPAYFDVPRTLQAGEAFRLRGEKLWRIEMTLTEVPYGMRTAFPGQLSAAPTDLRGLGTNTSVAVACDRACLTSVLGQVLRALLAHDISGLPLAAGARYSENGQFLPFGNGIWNADGLSETVVDVAMPGADAYAAVFTDPAGGTVAYWGRTVEATTPGVLALRIQVEGGKITEIEAVAVRAESVGNGVNTVTLMRPPLPVEWAAVTPLGRLDPLFQQDVVGAASIIAPAVPSAYFDGLARHSSTGVPFSPSCARRDMAAGQNVSCAAQLGGSGVAPDGLYNATSAVRDRRILITDSSKGVVLAVAMVDNPAVGASLPATENVPSTYMMPQLIKIENGTISRVEGMIHWMPYGYTSVWTEQNIS